MRIPESKGKFLDFGYSNLPVTLRSRQKYSCSGKEKFDKIRSQEQVKITTICNG